MGSGATTTHDLIVVGGGAGGLTAVREARRRGARPVLVQDGPVGGDCTFTGCVPSKALLAAAARGASYHEAMQSVRHAVARVAATEDAKTLSAEGITVVEGWARVVDRTTVEVNGRRLRSRRLVIATGARPTVPPIPGLAGTAFLTSETLFGNQRGTGTPTPPARMAVIGGGPIGAEMGQAFARLGTEVAIVEGAARLLPKEEPEASAVVAAALAADGVALHLGVSVVAVEGAAGGLRLSSGATIQADTVVVAVGRTPAGRDLGLEDVGVQIDERGAVVVDDTMATSVAGIWAVGDVVGRHQLTHAAGRMGWIAVTNALSRTARLRPRRWDDAALPWATFTAPEVGRVGLTEAEAAERHRGALVAHLPLSAVDRAVAVGAEAGFVKLVAVARGPLRHLGGGRLVGATIVAPTGGELVHEAALAIQTKMFAGRLAQTPHAYPTWSMAIQQTALQFVGDPSGRRARPARPD